MSVATFKSSVILRQLDEGNLEINIAALSRDEIDTFITKLRAQISHVRSLRLIIRPRGQSWLQYHFSNLQALRAKPVYVYSSEHHLYGVQVASANVQHGRIRRHFNEAIQRLLTHGKIEELELGMRLSESGYRSLAIGLAANKTLKRLTFAGSRIGDNALLLLKPGLLANHSLEQIDLTACGLSDVGLVCLSSILKIHAERRIQRGWGQALRCYPDISLPQEQAALLHSMNIRDIARNVNSECAGLLHLELAENQMTDAGTHILCEALGLDRRLMALSLRANLLTSSGEGELVECMKEHQALMRVDLRQNLDPQMGILKLKKQQRPQSFSQALGMQLGGMNLRAGPGRPGLTSPALTETSMPFWELPQAEGSSPVSPRTKAKRLTLQMNMLGRASVLSWGDQNLMGGGSPTSPGLAHLLGPHSRASGQAPEPQSAFAHHYLQQQQQQQQDHQKPLEQQLNTQQQQQQQQPAAGSPRGSHHSSNSSKRSMTTRRNQSVPHLNLAFTRLQPPETIPPQQQQQQQRQATRNTSTLDSQAWLPKQVSSNSYALQPGMFQCIALSPRSASLNQLKDRTSGSSLAPQVAAFHDPNNPNNFFLSSTHALPCAPMFGLENESFSGGYAGAVHTAPTSPALTPRAKEVRHNSTVYHAQQQSLGTMQTLDVTGSRPTSISRQTLVAAALAASEAAAAATAAAQALMAMLQPEHLQEVTSGEVILDAATDGRRSSSIVSLHQQRQNSPRQADLLKVGTQRMGAEQLKLMRNDGVMDGVAVARSYGGEGPGWGGSSSDVSPGRAARSRREGREQAQDPKVHVESLLRSSMDVGGESALYEKLWSVQKANDNSQALTLVPATTGKARKITASKNPRRKILSSTQEHVPRNPSAATPTKHDNSKPDKHPRKHLKAAKQRGEAASLEQTIAALVASAQSNAEPDPDELAEVAQMLRGIEEELRLLEGCISHPDSSPANSDAGSENSSDDEQRTSHHHNRSHPHHQYHHLNSTANYAPQLGQVLQNANHCRDPHSPPVRRKQQMASSATGKRLVRETSFLDHPTMAPAAAQRMETIAAQLERWCGLCDEVLTH